MGKCPISPLMCENCAFYIGGDENQDKWGESMGKCAIKVLSVDIGRIADAIEKR